MTTLIQQPLAGLIDALFAEAEAPDATLAQEVKRYSEEELAALMSSKTGYRELYTRLGKSYLAVSRETATLLYMLARSTGARNIVEFGTSFGISTLHLAAAVKDNGGGIVIGSEFESAKVIQARNNIAKAGLSDYVDIREGDALETLARDLPETIDLVLLDGAKGLYPAVLSLIEKRLRKGALVIADNAHWSEEYLARVRAPANGFLSVPFSSEVELSMRLGS